MSQVNRPVTPLSARSGIKMSQMNRPRDSQMSQENRPRDSRGSFSDLALGLELYLLTLRGHKEVIIALLVGCPVCG